MSRYANRLAPPPTSTRYKRLDHYYEEDAPPPPRGYRGGPVAVDDEEDDDDTAVGTDLSGLQEQQKRRGVSFGQNEIEEFNGSEAPEAVMPARSRSSMGHRPAPPALQPPPQPARNSPGIDRPRSTSLDGRRPPPQNPRPPPPRSTPQPPAYSNGRGSTPVDRDRGYNRPVSFARAGGYPEPIHHSHPDDEDDDDDDDDAFTAVGTGVATDLDLDDDPRGPSPASQGYGFAPADQRDRRGYAQEPQGGFSASARPPSRGVQIYREPPPNSHPQFASVHTHYPRSASGYEASDFSMDGEDAPPAGLMPPPPLPSSRRASASPGGAGGLAPPRSIARPVSTGSMRMLVDEHGEGGLSPSYGSANGGIGRQGTPRSQPRPMEEDHMPQDSPVEKELIALLKELRFSIALKDFHDTMQINVTKTLVAEDGMGHAYCKVHCKKLPRHEDIAKQAHLRNHWIPLAGSRWEFRTASHRVTVVFKTAALAAYEAQFLTSRR
ncbi:hypothetical protein JCM11641_007186 [Rhodosporidiobolus odoratus]